MTKIFISYRRDDSAHVFRLIYKNLTPPLGNTLPENIFINSEGMPTGGNPRRYIDQRVSQCAVVVVIIGRDWVTDRIRKRRLDTLNDEVRLALEAALRHKIPIIPLIIVGATMPQAQLLPASIAAFAGYPPAFIRRAPDFETDVANLMQTVAQHVLSAHPVPSPVKSIPKLEPIRESFAKLLHTLHGHDGIVNGCTFSPDGRILATTSHDRTIRLWDATNEQFSLLHAIEAHQGFVLGGAFNPDGTMFASVSNDKTARLWRVSASNLALIATLDGHTHVVDQCAFSPNGQMLATSAWDSTLRLWDVSTDKPALIAALKRDSSAITSCAFSPDGRTLASTSQDATLCLWDVSHKPPTLLHCIDLEEGSSCCVFSSDGRILAAESGSHIELWDLTQPEPKQLYKLEDNGGGLILDCAFSPDGRILATASFDKTVCLWDVSGDQPVFLQTLNGHTESVNACAFSPDGRTLATASNDKTIKIWSIPN